MANQYLPPQGRAGAASVPALEDGEFQNTVQQVKNHQRDADRQRLLRNLIISYSLSCAQARAFVDEIEFTEAKVEAAILLHESVRDRDAFEATVLPALRFDEQRNQVRAKLGLGGAAPAAAAAPSSTSAPAPAKAAAPSKDASSWMRQKKASSDSDDDSD